MKLDKSAKIIMPIFNECRTKLALFTACSQTIYIQSDLLDKIILLDEENSQVLCIRRFISSTFSKTVIIEW